MLGGHTITHATLNTLRAQLPAAITKLNADPLAPIQLAQIEDRNFLGHGRNRIPGYPSVEVSCPDTRYVDFDIPGDHADAAARLYVMVRLQARPAEGFEAMAEAAQRYAAAVVSVLASPDACGPGTTLAQVSQQVRSVDLGDGEDQTGRIDGRRTGRFMNAFVAAEVQFTTPLGL